MIDVVFVLILFAAILLVAAWYEMLYLMMVDGKMRRGFCFRQVPLTEDELEFLQSLKRDTTRIDERYIRFERVMRARGCNFIQRQGDEVYIQHRRRGFGTGWPFIGYVNLSQEPPRLQFRGSLLMHLLFPAWLFLIVLNEPGLVGVMLAVMLGLLAVLAVNHWIVTAGIREYLRALAADAEV